MNNYELKRNTSKFVSQQTKNQSLENDNKKKTNKQLLKTFSMYFIYFFNTVNSCQQDQVFTLSNSMTGPWS